MRLLIVLVVVLIAGIHASAQEPNSNQPSNGALPGKEKGGACDSSGFIAAAIKSEELRKEQKINVAKFQEFARDPSTVILDARSVLAYRHMHVTGSINLPYTAFSQEALEKVIPAKSTRILIYCRNNFTHIPNSQSIDDLPPSMQGYELDFSFRKGTFGGLNIPTFITLYIYGYRNVWELDTIVNPENTDLPLEGKYGRAE